MIHVYAWNATDKAGAWKGAEGLERKPGPADVVWFDLEEPTPEEEQSVF